MSEIRYFTDGEQATAAVLNRPLQDLEKTGQYMSKAQFDMLAEERREKYTGSGFIELGKHHPSYIVNKGIWCGTNSTYSNRFFWNRPAAAGGIGEGPQHAIVNAEGSRIKIQGYNAGNHGEGVLLPDAPSASFETNMNSLSKKYNPTDIFILKDFSDVASFSDRSLSFTGNDTTTTYSGTGETRDHFISGSTYKITFTISNLVTSGDGNIQMNMRRNGNSSYRDFSISTQNGISKAEAETSTTISETFIAYDTNYFIYFEIWGKTGELSCDISNVSIELVEPEIICNLTNSETGTDMFSKINDFKRLDSISRKDFVFLESWHELVSEKDIVYPYGNVQYNQSGQSLSVSISKGTFDGFKTYSLFGNWQEENTLVGKGYVWSTLSQEDKLKFAQNSENNIYMSKDGLAQVRYRIRVMKMPGNTNGSFYGYSGTSQYGDSYGWEGRGYIMPQGSRTTIFDTNGLGTAFNAQMTLNGLDNWINYYGHSTSYNANLVKDIRGVLTSAGSIKVGDYRGVAPIAVPIAFVQRKNIYAYDPVFNSEGTAKFNDGKFWYETTSSKNNLEDCINNASSSIMADGLCGRPDSTYSDSVIDKDIEDLRILSYRNEDKNSLLMEEMKNVISGRLRGKEYTSSYRELKWGKNDSRPIWLGSNNLDIDSEIQFYTLGHSSIHTNAYEHVFEIGETLPIYFSNGGYMLILITSKQGVKESYRGLIKEVSNFTMDNLSLKEGFYYYPKDVKCFIPTIQENFTQNGKMLHCDIIGDPANYPQDWKDNGIFGTPLLASENGESMQLKDITSVTYNGTKGKYVKLSRKLSSFRKAIFTNVVTGEVITSTRAYNHSGAASPAYDAINYGVVASYVYNNRYSGYKNCIVIPTDGTHTNGNSSVLTEDETSDNYLSNWIIQVFYETACNNTFLSSESEVLAVGRGRFAQWGLSNYGGGVSNNLLSKVAEGYGQTGTYPSNIAEDFNIDWTTSNNANVIQAFAWVKRITHSQINATNGGGGAKFFPYLSKDNEGRAYIKLVFKEMKWNSENDLDNIIEYTAGTTVETIKRGTPMKFAGFTNEDFNGRVFTFSSDLTSITVDAFDGYIIGSDNKIITTSGSFSGYQIFEGNGWGDDNQFQTLNNVGLFNNDNGDKVLYGTKAIKLPYYLD